jgi:hypothetical protein
MLFVARRTHYLGSVGAERLMSELVVAGPGKA